MATSTGKNHCHVHVAIYDHNNDYRMLHYNVNLNQFLDRYVFNGRVKGVCRILYRLFNSFFAIGRGLFLPRYFVCVSVPPARF